MQSSKPTASTVPQYCYYLLITLLISLTLAEQSSLEFNNDDDIVKRATTGHSHNIMRFGRNGHNIMHFGKRGDESATADSSALDTDTEPMEPALYEPIPYSIGQRSIRARYFIPHAFIASLYNHPRSFLKKAGDTRENLFMHFG